MKRFSILILLVVAALIFSSCSKTDTKSDVTVTQISETVDKLISNSENLTAVDNDYIKGSLGIDTSTFDDYILKIQTSGTSLDEYGIFKAKNNNDVKDIEKIIDDYILTRNNAWTHQYMPEEYPKLKNAESKIVGLYVMYAILSDTDKVSIFREFESLIK